MLDIGWTELLVIGIVALIVVGPKDLPLLFRRLGEFTGKARAMAREFSSAMDRAADEAGVRDVQKNFRDVANPKKMGLDALNRATDDWAEWDGDAAGKSGASKPAASSTATTSTTADAAKDMKAAETPPVSAPATPPTTQTDEAKADSDTPDTRAPRDEKTA